jgi:hypothetical protein
LKERRIEEPEGGRSRLWRDYTGDFNMHKGLLMAQMLVAEAEQ